jgi:hypothetical protein
MAQVVQRLSLQDINAVSSWLAAQAVTLQSEPALQAPGPASSALAVPVPVCGSVALPQPTGAAK